MQFNDESEDTGKVTRELLSESERQSLDSTAKVMKAQAEWRETYFKGCEQQQSSQESSLIPGK